MLNAVSSGSRLTNVTPVRSGGSRSNSCGFRARPQPASASAPKSTSIGAKGIGSGDRWPLRFGSLTAPPPTPGSLTSGATGRVADARATTRGGPEGEDARGCGAVVRRPEPEGPPLVVADILVPSGVIYRAGRIRIACPPPGASTRCRRDFASTGRWVIATGSGLVSQFAPGPSA